MSDVCDTVRVCVGCVSLADEKSRSSLLTKRCRVFGAEDEFDVRIMTECNFTAPAKLWRVT